jgi:hypothetical protein
MQCSTNKGDYRMSSKRNLIMVFTFVLALAGMSVAQTTSNVLTVPLTATVAESLTISNTGPANVNFGTVAPGSAATSANLTFNEKWVLSVAHNTVNFFAYFATNTNADLMHGTSSPTTTIPYSAFQATPQGGSATTFAALPAVSATAYGVQIANHTSVSPVNMGAGTNDQFTLTLNMPGTQAADTYNGTLTVRAQTN